MTTKDFLLVVLIPSALALGIGFAQPWFNKWLGNILGQRSWLASALKVAVMAGVGVAVGITIYGVARLAGQTAVARDAGMIAGVATILVNVLVLLRFAERANPELESLRELQQILGVDEWESDHKPGQLEEHDLVHSRMDFMGMGFHKWTGRTAEEEHSFTSLVGRVRANAVDGQVRAILMHPFSNRVSEFEAQSDTKGADSTPSKILSSLRVIADMRDRGLPVEARFYPEPRKASPTFRMMLVDNTHLFLSYYKFRNSGYSVPQLRFPLNQGDSTFAHPFTRLFEYMWEAGEQADYYRLHLDMQAKDVTTVRGRRLLSRFLADSLSVRYSAGNLDHLRVAVVAVAGKDSLAVIRQAMRSGEYHAIVPVIIEVPTEERSAEIRINSLAPLRRRGEEQFEVHRCLVTSAIVVRENGLWDDLLSEARAGAPQPQCSHLSSCIACHFYIHAMRSAVASALGVRTVLSGDREQHDKRLKANQSGPVLDAYATFAHDAYGVELAYPLRAIESEHEVYQLLDDIEIGPDSRCRLGASMVDRDCPTDFDPESWAALVRERLAKVFTEAMRTADVP